jgi:hypothetical protein
MSVLMQEGRLISGDQIERYIREVDEIHRKIEARREKESMANGRRLILSILLLLLVMFVLGIAGTTI